MAATFAPVMEARRWLDGVSFPPDRPLLNVSQAAPVDPPPEGLRRALAEAAINDPAAHLYGPVLGLPELRAEVAAQWSAAYGGAIAADEVAITQGCNQAFCAITATLAGAGMRSSFQPLGISITRCGWTCRGSPQCRCRPAPA